MIDKTLKSGAVLSLQIADFEDSMALLDAILKETIGVPIEGFDAETIFKENSITLIKDALFKVISSRVVKEALWKCMTSCTYQAPGTGVGTQIKRDTFNSLETRPDFFPVAGEVTTFNLSPFFKNLELPSAIRGKSEETEKPPKSATA